MLYLNALFSEGGFELPDVWQHNETDDPSAAPFAKDDFGYGWLNEKSMRRVMD